MGFFSRRSFLRQLCTWVFLPIFHPIVRKPPIPHNLPAGIQAKMREKGDITDHFLGEELCYRMSVLWIKQAAIGRVLFEKGEGGKIYRATIQGKTTGIIGWLTRYRRDTYTSYMELINGGRRLRPLRFEEDIVIGEKIRKKITIFDYRGRRFIKRRMNRKGVFIQSEEEIPAGVIYDDFLTAFYNFRRGVYGVIQRGRRYRVRTLPKPGISTIDVEIATEKEEMRFRHGKRDKRGAKYEYYVTVSLDKEITRSRTGRVKGWVSKDLVPIEGTIEDVVFVGDVRGFLIGKGRMS